ALPQPPGAAAVPTIVALQHARGRFVHEQNTLQLADVALEAAPSNGRLAMSGGAVVTSLHDADPLVRVDGVVNGDHWEHLPGISPRMTRRLRGGAYTARVAIASPFSQLATATASGDFKLTGARLVLPGGGG